MSQYPLAFSISKIVCLSEVQIGRGERDWGNKKTRNSVFEPNCAFNGRLPRDGRRIMMKRIVPGGWR